MSAKIDTSKRNLRIGFQCIQKLPEPRQINVSNRAVHEKALHIQASEPFMLAQPFVPEPLLALFPMRTLVKGKDGRRPSGVALR